MVPKLAYRWTPEAEDVARDFWKQQPKTITVATEPVSNSPDEAVPTDPTATVDSTLAVAASSLPLPTESDWTDFRGNQRDGLVRGTGFRIDWDQRSPTEVWRHPVGLAWSSFAVLGDFAITMEQRDEQESVVCYHLQTGEPIWIHGDVTRFTAVEVNGGDGPHATPVIVGERTYSLGGTGILNCLETATGRKVWTRNVLEDAGDGTAPATNLQWGLSGTPLVQGDRVYVIAGGTAGKSVITYDRYTGDMLWTGGKFPASYGGPRIEEFGGIPQLLAFHGLGITAFAPETGTELWSFPFENMPKVNSAQPLKIADDALVIGTGYGVGATRLKLSSQGSVWTAEPQWKSNRFKLKFNDAVAINGFLYGLDDGILTCLDPETGKTKWKSRRVGYGQLVAYGETLIIVSEEGDVILGAVSPEKFTEVHSFHAVDGTTWNHPAVAHGKLLIRNQNLAVCYDIRP
jgi:outer membrane protein assembly factor BamB